MDIKNLNFPKYVKSADGFIGTFKSLDFGLFPIYQFEGGCRLADPYELKHGSDSREELEK